MAEQVAVELDVGPFGHMLSSGIAGSHGGFSFSFLRDFNADFNNNWTSLQNQQQGMRVLFPHILFSVDCHFVVVADLRHSDWGKLESQSCFNLHFSNF